MLTNCEGVLLFHRNEFFILTLVYFLPSLSTKSESEGEVARGILCYQNSWLSKLLIGLKLTE